LGIEGGWGKIRGSFIQGESMAHVSVTWLELFFDLSVVIAVHNVAVPIEEKVNT